MIAPPQQHYDFSGDTLRTFIFDDLRTGDSPTELTFSKVLSRRVSGDYGEGGENGKKRLSRQRQTPA